MGAAIILGVLRLALAFTRASLRKTDGNGMARMEGMQDPLTFVRLSFIMRFSLTESGVGEQTSL